MTPQQPHLFKESQSHMKFVLPHLTKDSNAISSKELYGESGCLALLQALTAVLQVIAFGTRPTRSIASRNTIAF